MPVLDLKYITNDAVGSLTFDKILSSYLIIHCIWKTKLINKVLIKGTSVCFSHLISAYGIRNDFYNTTYI